MSVAAEWGRKSNVPPFAHHPRLVVIRQLESGGGGWGVGGQTRLVIVSETGLASHPLFYITACLQES